MDQVILIAQIFIRNLKNTDVELSLDDGSFVKAVSKPGNHSYSGINTCGLVM